MSEGAFLAAEFGDTENTPQQRHRAALAAVRYAVTQDDPAGVAGDLLDMLGLRGEGPDNSCRVCGGRMSVRALADRGKYRRTCGDICLRVFAGGDG